MWPHLQFTYNKCAVCILRPGDEEVHLTKAVRSTVEAEEDLEEADDGVNWKTVDLSKPDLPAGLKELAKGVKVVQEEKTIMGVSTFIQRASPPSKGARVSGKKTVLLLHGAAFSSQTWVSVVPTVATLAGGDADGDEDDDDENDGDYSGKTNSGHHCSGWSQCHCHWSAWVRKNKGKVEQNSEMHYQIWKSCFSS